jgi:hypothetical protein
MPTRDSSGLCQGFKLELACHLVEVLDLVSARSMVVDEYNVSLPLQWVPSQLPFFLLCLASRE